MIQRLVLGHAAFNVAKMCFCGVGLRRGHVAHYLAAVKRNPFEGSVREVVDIVPAEFLGKEAAHARQPADLRDLT